MRALTSNVEDLFSHFHKNDETQTENNKTTLKHLLVNNHDMAAKKSKLKVIYHWNIFLDFVEYFEKLLII